MEFTPSFILSASTILAAALGGFFSVKFGLRSVQKDVREIKDRTEAKDAAHDAELKEIRIQQATDRGELLAMKAEIQSWKQWRDEIAKKLDKLTIDFTTFLLTKEK